MKKLYLLLICSLFSFSVFAQDNAAEQGVEEMETDRPSRGDASSIVPKGHYQLELGFNYKRDETNFINVRELNYPETVFRMGVMDFAELRVKGQITRVQTEITGSPDQESKFVRSGLDRIMLGTKIRLLKNEGARPEAALQADFQLPIGSNDFNGGKIAPKLRLNFSNKLSERFALKYNLGLEWEEIYAPLPVEEDLTHLWLYTLELDYKISDDFMVFIEAFGDLRENDMQQSFDFGVVYKIKPNIQIDANLGYGISEEAIDFTGTTGISFRLPE